MKIKQSFLSRLFDVVNVLGMLFMMFLCFYPFYYVVIQSFSDSTYLVGDVGFMLLPKGFNLDAYKAVMRNPNIFTGYRMTILILVFGTLLNLVLTSLGAYVVTRKHFKPAKVLLKLMIFTMYFSGGMIPGYILVNNYLHLGNSLLALILPGAISTYNLMIMKTNFASIPDSIEEAAKIDGANDFLIFVRIILPLSVATIAVMVLFYGVGHWNAWFNALLYIDDRTRYPLQLVLREILLLNEQSSMMVGEMEERYAIAEAIKGATIVVTTLPILFVYPFIQKYFVKGIMIGAVKG